MQSEATNELAAALAKAQGTMKAATFNKINPHFKNRYADLAAVVDAIRAPLSANGLAYTQATEVREGGLLLVTTLLHSSGQWVASEYPLPQAARPQELGSALTYAKRYSLSAIVGVAADDDDDAEGARAKDQTSSTPKAKEATRVNPHVTRPEDLVDDIEYDEQGDPVDNVPWGDAAIKRMPAAHSRGDAAKANNEMLAFKTAKELRAWMVLPEIANRVDSWPRDWSATFRGRLAERLKDLDAKETANGKHSEPENLLQAG